jgi:hypothetical protein
MSQYKNTNIKQLLLWTKCVIWVRHSASNVTRNLYAIPYTRFMNSGKFLCGFVVSNYIAAYTVLLHGGNEKQEVKMRT